MTAVRPGKWLLRRPRNDVRARLFCLPYSGVGASMYTQWPRLIGDDVEVCPVQLPARENRLREQHYGSYEELARLAVDGLRPYLDRPFGLFGHCGGALAAFAIALYLDQVGGPAPQALFTSSQVAPHDGPFGRFLHLDDEELKVELAHLTRVMGGEPNPAAIELGLTVLRADIAAHQNYRLDAPVRLRAAVRSIGWEDDQEIRPSQMDGWPPYAADGRFAGTVLSGGHHTFRSAPDELLKEFEAGLAPEDRPQS
ncbi:thioesterase domain-containing protein [Streptomyces sp. NPDC000070]|uniref:thioesterase II family protein n=1 Tax=Streptomyces sp. NPDC000070 TaxID=3154240 RepID=UPI0033263335